MLAETICSAVSAAGLGIAAVTAYRRRFMAAARIAAYALVPVGLVMTGVVEWLTGIVFNPTVWIGFGLLGLAWLILATTRRAERRRPVDAGKPPKRTKAGPSPATVAPAASKPSLGTAPPQAPADDFSDIEAILKKHGI